MKWPLSLTIIRHAQSTYNVLRDRKKNDPEYRKFVVDFDNRVNPKKLKKTALVLQEKFAQKVSDYKTDITTDGRKQAVALGKKIISLVHMPDVVFVSPYLRTMLTWEMITVGANSNELNKVTVIPEDRVREQEHGLALLYSDWRIFQTIHPEQRALYEMQGKYWYQYPQGESVSEVRERIRSFKTTLVREYAGAHVWVVSHHLTKLAFRANLERLTPEQFIYLDEHEKPINCGVTHYAGDPAKGKNGRLELSFYNRRVH